MKKQKPPKVVQYKNVAMSWDEFIGEVRKLLVARKGEMREIEKDTGLTYRWIIDFKRQVYRDVTADNVIRLCQWLGLRFRVHVDAAQVADRPPRATTGRLTSP